MARLIGEVPFHGLRYEGRRFDCGDKVGFLEAQIAFALKRPDLAPAVRAFLKNYVHACAEPVAERAREGEDCRWASATTSIRTLLREYDIRGIVGRTLHPADAFAIGRVFGSIVAAGRRADGGGRVTTAGSRRPELEPTLVEGLRGERDGGAAHRAAGRRRCCITPRPCARPTAP